MKNWCGQLDMTEVTRALLHILTAGRTHGSSINRTKLGVVKTMFTRLLALLILHRNISAEFLAWHCAEKTATNHCLRIENVLHTHALDLLGGQEAELDLLYGAQRRTRVHKLAGEVDHVGGIVSSNYGMWVMTTRCGFETRVR